MPDTITRALRTGIVALCVALAAPVQAQNANIPITRDAEIEALVADYARPLLKAAGLRQTEVEIILVRDNRFNAFVAGRRLFINTGVFLAADTPNEIIAILAHEIGHIAGGHQERLRSQLALAKTQAIVAQIAGIGATIAGAAAKSEGLAGAGRGIMTGGQEAVRRNFLAYKRTEESAADRAAVRYLEATGQSPAGLQTTFRRFQAMRSLDATTVNPYLLSHPLPRERFSAIDALVRASPYRDRKDPAELQQRHDRARAKVAAYTAGPAVARRIIPKENTAARNYADAISTYLRGSPADAVRKIDAVVAENPNDAYVHEMRGEILLRVGRPAEAVPSFKRALKLTGNRSPILRAEIGRALLETNDPTRFAEAISNLRQAVVLDPSYARGYQTLAKAFRRIGDDAAANLATAEALYALGQKQRASVFAKRAQDGFEGKGPSWLRAQDIINAR